MFGLVAAGRGPQQFSQVGQTDFVCEVGDAESVNHVVVFMTGSEPFPDEFGGSVYIRWPLPSGQESSWHYLGFVCNKKPSAIFKIGQLHLSEVRHAGIFVGDGMSTGTQGSAQLGIMAESLSVIEGRHETEGTHAGKQSLLAEFADKMVRNLVNHAQSYAVRLPKPDGTGTADYIPINALGEWFNSFSRRFQQNPYFWRTLNNN